MTRLMPILICLGFLLLSAADARSDSLRSLTGLSEVAVYEQSIGMTRIPFAPNAVELLTRRPDPLTEVNRDFGFVNDESYDVFYSDPYGNPSPNGSFLTVEGVWRRPELRPDGGMNINEVALVYGGANPRMQYGDYVVSFAIGSIHDQNFGNNYIPGSEVLAVDHNLSTFPRFGQTSTTDRADRMRLTIGFNDISARRVPLTIDPALSSVTFTAIVEGVLAFDEQAPGSMTMALAGSLAADLVGAPGAWTDIRFHSTNDIHAVGYAGPFLPGNAPADLAGVLNFGDETAPVLVYATFRGSVADLSSEFTPVDDLGGFASNEILLSLTSTLDYDVAGLLVGSRTDTLGALLSGQGSIEQIGDTLFVTIPVDLSGQLDVNGLMLDYHYAGQIVATAQLTPVPEPSTLVLAGFGALGAVVFGVRRGKGRRAWRPGKPAQRIALVLLGACLVACWPASVCQAVPLKVMSFNILSVDAEANYIRTDRPWYQQNRWFNEEDPTDARRLKAFAVIHDEAPDIIGMQEVSSSQLADLKGEYQSGEGLLEYDYYWQNRTTVIFYRRDRFTRIDQGGFWMSLTPDVPGSAFPGVTPAFTNWVVLDDRTTGRQYFVLNTHLSSVADARTLGAQLIQSKLQELAGDLPILLTGDFNGSETSAALLALTAPTGPNDITLEDPYRMLHPTKTFFESSGGAFTGVTIGSRIDYVLSSPDFMPVDAAIVRTSYDGKWPSDHYPVTATFDVTPVPEPSTFALAALGAVGLLVLRTRRRAMRVALNVTALASLTATLSGPAKADDLFTYFGGHSYLLTTGLSTWTDAEAQAVLLGGHLVTINSSLEQDFLVAAYLTGSAGESSRSFWIGINDAAVEGTFNWVSGEPVTYTKWHAGEPNNFTNAFAVNGEDYGVINWHLPQQGNGTIGAWNDAPNNGLNGALNGPLPLRGMIELNQIIAGISTQLAIDPTQSYVTLTADVEGIVPFEEQAPGSMTTALAGSLSVDLMGTPGAWTNIRFQSTGDILPVSHAGPFLPGDGPADLAGKVNLGDEAQPVLVYAAFRGSVGDLTSGFTPVDELGRFALDNLLMSLTTTLDYDVAGLLVGSTTESQGSLLAGQGTIEQIGNTLYVTIPIDVSFPLDANGLAVNYSFTGQIVATAQLAAVPEPSTFVLAGIGALGACLIGARRGKGRRAWRPGKLAQRIPLVLLSACLAVCWPAGACRADQLKVVSFNILNNNLSNDTGSNDWFNIGNPDDARRLRAFNVIDDEAPDILGLQEVSPEQLADLNGQYISGQGLLDYDHYAVDKGDGEYDAAIFYRHDRFTRVDQGTFWMSQTPDVPGSKFPSASGPRIASWVILEDHQTGKEYFVLNTHLDHVNVEARTLSGQLIQSKLQQLAGGLPILVTGDLNANETSAALLALTAPTGPGAITLEDPYRILNPVKTFFESSGGGFAGVTIGSRIDFVLSSPDFMPTDAAIVRTSYDGKWPSDHYPVTATFDVTPVPEPSTAVLGLIGALGLLVTARKRRKSRSRTMPLRFETRPLSHAWRTLIQRVVIQLGIMLLGGFAASSAIAAPVLWDTAIGGNGHYYERIDARSISWTQASAAAAALSFNGWSGYLATVTSQAENDFLVAHIDVSPAPFSEFWLGGFQDTSAPDFSEPAGGWRWITGEPFLFTNWGSSEPNQFFGRPENYLSTLAVPWKWNDSQHNSPDIFGYVVEYAAQGIQFTIDPALSSVTLTADVEGILPFQEQTPGSMTTALFGSLAADLVGTPGAWTSIRFQSTSDILPVSHAGPFLPGDGPADLAGKVNLGDETQPVLVYAAFRDSVGDLSSGFTPVDELGGFALDNLLMSLTTTLDYDVAGLLVGSTTESQGSLLAGQGTIEQIGNTLYVTIPIDMSFQGDANGLTINYNYTGQIVGTAQLAAVPEPSTFAMAAVGGVLLLGVLVKARSRPAGAIRPV